MTRIPVDSADARELREIERDRSQEQPRPRPTAKNAATKRDPKPWCGRCDERTRTLDTDEDRIRRCPDCHPLAIAVVFNSGRDAAHTALSEAIAAKICHGLHRPHAATRHARAAIVALQELDRTLEHERQQTNANTEDGAGDDLPTLFDVAWPGTAHRPVDQVDDDEAEDDDE